MHHNHKNAHYNEDKIISHDFEYTQHISPKGETCHFATKSLNRGLGLHTLPYLLTDADFWQA